MIKKTSFIVKYGLGLLFIHCTQISLKKQDMNREHIHNAHPYALMQQPESEWEEEEEETEQRPWSADDDEEEARDSLIDVMFNYIVDFYMVEEAFDLKLVKEDISYQSVHEGDSLICKRLKDILQDGGENIIPSILQKLRLFVEENLK